MTKEQENKKYLVSLGITQEGLQEAAIGKIPCGEKLIEDCMKDSTDVFANAPRALIICDYRGFITGLSCASERKNDERIN